MSYKIFTCERCWKGFHYTEKPKEIFHARINGTQREISTEIHIGMLDNAPVGWRQPELCPKCKAAVLTNVASHYATLPCNYYAPQKEGDK